MGYEFLEDVALADVACKVWGDTLEALLTEAGVALVNVMINNIDAIQENESRSIHVCGETMEMLLFNFLQEIIYYKDAEKLLLVYFQLDIENTQKEWVLNCRAAGEVLDPLRHEQLVDVKSVTLHQLDVSRNDRGWSAFIILDI